MTMQDSSQAPQGQTTRQYLEGLVARAEERHGLGSRSATMFRRQLDALTKEPDYVAEQKLINIINGSSEEQS
jgi:hypothetical protein